MTGIDLSRTVRSESTKDKAGALPSDDPGTDNEERVDQDTNIPRATNEIPRITFVDESMLGVVAVGDVTDLPEKEDEFDRYFDRYFPFWGVVCLFMGKNNVTTNFLMLVLKWLKINCLMLYSEKIKCLVLSKYPHSDPLMQPIKTF